MPTEKAISEAAHYICRNWICGSNCRVCHCGSAARDHAMQIAHILGHGNKAPVSPGISPTPSAA